MTRTFYAMLIPCLLLGACASLVDENLGKAQAQMIRNQVYDPSTLQGSQDRPVEGMDPDSAKAAVDAMRKDVPDRSNVKHDVGVTVGTQQSGGSQ
jgi:hypothetical protein